MSPAGPRHCPGRHKPFLSVTCCPSKWCVPPDRPSGPYGPTRVRASHTVGPDRPDGAGGQGGTVVTGVGDGDVDQGSAEDGWACLNGVQVEAVPDHRPAAAVEAPDRDRVALLRKGTTPQGQERCGGFAADQVHGEKGRTAEPEARIAVRHVVSRCMGWHRFAGLPTHIAGPSWAWPWVSSTCPWSRRRQSASPPSRWVSVLVSPVSPSRTGSVPGAPVAARTRPDGRAAEGARDAPSPRQNSASLPGRAGPRRFPCGRRVAGPPPTTARQHKTSLSEGARVSGPR